jgi:chromosomal replication initiation ATPase DnaA
MMYLLREKQHFSFREIARVTARKHHTTALYACGMVGSPVAEERLVLYDAMSPLCRTRSLKWNR